MKVKLLVATFTFIYYNIIIVTEDAVIFFLFFWYLCTPLNINSVNQMILLSKKSEIYELSVHILKLVAGGKENFTIIFGIKRFVML